ncbi:MAG: hypothetical protein ACO3NK_03210 [Prochlorotrichaceae cyanobacterium]
MHPFRVRDQVVVEHGSTNKPQDRSGNILVAGIAGLRSGQSVAVPSAPGYEPKEMQSFEKL